MKMMIKPFLGGMLILITGIIVSCKKPMMQPESNGQIQGVVLDYSSEKPLEGVQVTTNPPSSSITTGKEGKFSLNNMDVGNYAISIYKNGYQSNSVSVSVKSDKITQATVYLKKQTSKTVLLKAPTNPIPNSNANSQSTHLTLAWQDQSDSTAGISYDIYLYESNSPVQRRLASDVTDTQYTVSKLIYNTNYNWEIVSHRGDLTASSDLWSFKTRRIPDFPFVYASRIDGDYEIYLSDGTDSTKVQLTHNSYRDWWPRFSPDRKKIAFTSDENVEPQIYTMNVDGSEKTQVTTIGVTGYNNYGIGFCWSPDSKRFYYAHNDKLYRIDANGTDLKLIATAPSGRNFKDIDVASTGDKIVALTVGQSSYDAEIYIMNIDGSNMKMLVGNEPGKLDSPSFSVDGKRVMYTYDVSEYHNAEGRQLSASIFMINADSTGMVNISQNKEKGTNDLYPRYSPDGSMIIFTNQRNDGLVSPDIYEMSLDGKDRKKIIINGQMADWR